MVKSYDWSFLENQLHQIEDIQSKGSSSVTPPMDVTSSIITQVAREADHRNDNSAKGVAVRNSIKKRGKSEAQNATFRSMLCCFGRPRRKATFSSKPVPTSLSVTANGATDPTPPPTPSVRNANGPNSATPSINGDQKYLLPPRPQYLKHKKCAVIDLDETLVHSSFRPINNADFIVPVEIDGTVHQVYVLKRPHVDTYLQRMGELYECVLFTASLAKYADPVADLLDRQGVFTSRLFRESCVFHNGNYVKDLSLIGRELNHVIIVDNSPASYIFHPDNAVPVISWFDDPSDRELLDILPCLEEIAKSDDVYSVLRSNGFTNQAQETTATVQLQRGQPRNATAVLHTVSQNEDDEDR